MVGSGSIALPQGRHRQRAAAARASAAVVRRNRASALAGAAETAGAAS